MYHELRRMTLLSISLVLATYSVHGEIITLVHIDSRTRFPYFVATLSLSMRTDGFYQSQLNFRSTNRKKKKEMGCRHCEDVSHFAQ